MRANCFFVDLLHNVERQDSYIITPLKYPHQIPSLRSVNLWGYHGGAG